MGRTLQTLTIDLTANTANFSAAMTKASQISLSSTRNIAKSFALVGTAAAAMGAAMAGAVAGIVVKADEYVVSIQRMAEKTGQSTEEISKLAYATALTGGNLEDLGGLLMKFNRQAVEGAEGNRKAEGAFKTLGVSVTDSQGRFKAAGPLLEEVIGKLNAMPSSIKKTAVEMDIFGRSGAELAPTLKVLGANAAQTATDMQAFGLTVSKDTAEASEHLTQTLDRGKIALTGMSITVLTAALPALQSLADKVIALARDGQLVSFAKSLGEDVGKAAKLAGDGMQFFSDHGQALKRTLEALVALEIGSWLLSINTKALSAAGGLDVLASSVGKAILKMSGFSGLATGITAASVATRAYIADLIFFAKAEGVVATATEAITVAWRGLTAAVLANPITIALGLMAAGAYVFYKALADDVAESTKLGDAAVSFQDAWRGAIDNTVSSLHALKDILLTIRPEDMAKGVAEYKAIPTFGRRVHQVANDRAMFQKYASAPQTLAETVGHPPEAPPQPKPTPQPAKPDPYKEELAKVNQELRNSQMALNAAMQDSVDAQRAATESGKAGLIVTELQNKLKRDLTSTERAAITGAVRDTGENEHNAQVVESLRQRTYASKDALATSQALSRVVGQGAAADEGCDPSGSGCDARPRDRRVGSGKIRRCSGWCSSLPGAGGPRGPGARYGSSGLRPQPGRR